MTTQAVDNSIQPQLPRAVRQQMLRVAAIESKRTAGSPPPVPGEAPAPTETSSPPAGQAAPSPSPIAAPTPSSSATPPSGDPRESDPTYWRQRFKVTEGMLRTAQERHAAEIERRDEELQQLRTKVRELEANRAPAKIDLTSFFTPEQIERFGEDQCEVMAQAAMKAAGQHAQQLIETEVKPIQDRSKADAQKREDAKNSAFWERLTELYPAWEETNARADWLEWLKGEDSDTGMVLDQILQSHFRARNAEGVAKVFQRFEKANAKPMPPVAPAAAGSGGGGAQPSAAPSKGYPTAAEIKDFYKRSALRKVGDKERAEFEARLRLKAAA